MRGIAVLLAIFAILTPGCAKKGSRQVPVTGVVTLDGEPVPGVMLMFMPTEDSPGQGGYARTDKEGKFAVKHDLNGPGLVPGTYNVTVGSGPPVMDGQTGEAAPESPKKFPAKYGDPKSTPFARITVEPGTPLELQMESGATKQ